MVTSSLVSDELLLPEVSAQSSHPMDSSRVLLGLMALSRQAEAEGPETDTLEGIISKCVLRKLLSALHFRDVATVRHARHAAILSVGIAEYLGWEGRDLKLLEIAALLHDIGKIGVPDNVLFKPGQLSPDEAELMALHHNIGVDVLQACRVDSEVLEIVVQSHSHYNGATEDYRQIGSEMHQGARLLAVADAYDSLATDQVYRAGKPHDEIMKVLMDSAGTQFDGNIICALSRWVERDGLPFGGDAPETATNAPARGPAHTEDTLEASSLCHIFSYLYLLESLYDGFCLVDSDLRFVVWNRGAERLLGHPSQQMLRQVWTSRLLGHADQYGDPLPDREQPLHDVIATGRPSTSNLQLQHRDGKWVPVELQSVPLILQDGTLRGVAQIIRDVSRTYRRPQEYRELKLAASRDALTSVANRGELETQLTMMLAEFSQQPDGEPFSVIFVDVDHFKSINDSCGHTVGDRALVDMARLLQHETYSGELVARYGGEEFVVLCPGTQLDQAEKKAERLRLAVSNACIAELIDTQVTISLGVAEIEPGDSVESVLRRADKALYRAKESGRNQTCSLTSASLLAGEATTKQENEEPSDPFLFTATFAACIAADMVVYKLGGFVTDSKAKLVEVTPKRAVIRVGARGLLGFWGGTDERRPVELQIEFGEEQPSETTGRRGASHPVEVKVRIRPLGRIRDPEIFRERAKRVMKLLRSFFVAE